MTAPTSRSRSLREELELVVRDFVAFRRYTMEELDRLHRLHRPVSGSIAPYMGRHQHMSYVFIALFLLTMQLLMHFKWPAFQHEA